MTVMFAEVESASNMIKWRCIPVVWKTTYQQQNALAVIGAM